MNPLKKDLQYFLILCETQNISAAAEAAGIQQPGLSKSLKSLEAELDAPLFYRVHRGLKLTPLGESLKSSLFKINELWNELLDESLEKLEAIAGNFTLGVHQTIGENSLDKFYTDIVEKNRGLTLKLVFKRSPEVVEGVIQQEIDFGIVAEPFSHPDLVMKKLKTEYLGLWSAVRSPDQDSMLYYNPEMIQIAKVLKGYKGYKKVPIGCYSTIANLLLKGKGVGLLPSSVAEKHKDLQRIGKKLKTVDIILIYRFDLLKTPATQHIVKTISDAF
jgi:DNA-binding transcriptional LysR family regulator